MTADPRPGYVLQGPQFNEPMRVVTVQYAGDSAWLLGIVGTKTDRFRTVTLTAADLGGLSVLDSALSFAGDAKLLRLGPHGNALGFAHEFDPYFGLSISRVAPLPHQLAAVYDHLLKLPR